MECCLSRGVPRWLYTGLSSRAPGPTAPPPNPSGIHIPHSMSRTTFKGLQVLPTSKANMATLGSYLREHDFMRSTTKEGQNGAVDKPQSTRRYDCKDLLTWAKMHAIFSLKSRFLTLAPPCGSPVRQSSLKLALPSPLSAHLQ